MIRRFSHYHTEKGRRTFLPIIAFVATAGLSIPASAQTAQTPTASHPAINNLVTKAELETTGTQLRQRIEAQANDLAALRHQLLALKARMEALDRQVNGMKLPSPPAAGRVLPGY